MSHILIEFGFAFLLIYNHLKDHLISGMFDSKIESFNENVIDDDKDQNNQGENMNFVKRCY
jgi:hypothetical protein